MTDQRSPFDPNAAVMPMNPDGSVRAIPYPPELAAEVRAQGEASPARSVAQGTYEPPARPKPPHGTFAMSFEVDFGAGLLLHLGYYVPHDATDAEVRDAFCGAFDHLTELRRKLATAAPAPSSTFCVSGATVGRSEALAAFVRDQIAAACEPASGEA